MKRALASIAFLFTFAMAGAALAAEPAVKAPVPSSRQEYRACLNLQEKLKAQMKILDDHVGDNNNTIALLQVEAQVLAEAHKNMSPSDQTQVDAFNRQREEHNKKVVAATEQAERVKSEHDAYHAQTVEYNRTCATLVVRLDDRDAVLNERNESEKASAARP